MDILAIENRIGHRFNRQDLLRRALVHRSYVNEQPDKESRDNERLEFLGDAVLNLVVGHMLMERHPQVREGDLSRMRAGLVNEVRLAGIARELDLGANMLFGRGESISGGPDKASILADALEAVIAAVYLDGGFEAAFGFVADMFEGLIEDSDGIQVSGDAKSRLQEILQNKGQPPPTYELVEESGPAHDRRFTVQVDFLGETAKGRGRSKKKAEQQAARNAVSLLREKNGSEGPP